MANVSPIDGIIYGFRLMGYAIGVFLVSFLILVGGGVIVEGGSEIVGGLAMFVGLLAILAGFAGIQYKVIADGVEKGMNAARGKE